MNYIQQLKNDDCGFACLKMLLARIYKRKEYLYLKQDLNHGAYSYKELIDIANENGLTMNGYRYQDVEQLIHDKPNNLLLTFIGKNNSSHMVILRYVFAGRFYITDPYLGNYSLSRRKFEKLWDLTVLKVEEIRHNDLAIKKPYKIKTRDMIMLTLIRVFSLISGILGVFYIDKGIPMYIPIILISFYFIFEILYRVASLKAMQKLDQEVLVQVQGISGKNEDFINAFSTFKKMEILSFPNIVFSICICAFIVVVFVLNDVENFIPISIISLLTLFVDLFINPMLENNKKEIDEIEEGLKFEGDTYKFIEGFKSLNSKAYNFGNLFMVKNMGVIITISMITILFMYFKGITDLSFIVFYCFGYWFYQSNLSYIVSFKNQINQLKVTRCLLMNIIKDKK